VRSRRLRRRTVSAAAAAAVALLATGCGVDEREEVDAYIGRVNIVQQELLIPLTQASAAYREFTTSGDELEALRPRLEEAERSLRRLERRVAALDPPPAARRLHASVEELTAAQLALATELSDAAAYLLAFDEVLSPLASDERRFRSALRAAPTVQAQARALDGYAAAVEAARTKLTDLDPPPVLDGVHRTQSDTLTRVARSARELARGLRRGGSGQDLPPLVERFANAPLAAGSTAAQRLRIDAVEAYNARVARVQELAAAVERERLRLQDTLD